MRLGHHIEGQILKTLSPGPLSFLDYKSLFAGKGDYAGEHHFVGLCLVPLLINEILQNHPKSELGHISYINPDGMKSKMIDSKNKVLCDITYRDVGVEIKYSKGNSVKFTATQLESYKHLRGKLKGVLAIVNVDSEVHCRVVYIPLDKLFDVYKTDISAVLEKKEKTGRNHYCSIVANGGFWTQCSEANYLGIFGFIGKFDKGAA